MTSHLTNLWYLMDNGAAFLTFNIMINIFLLYSLLRREAGIEAMRGRAYVYVSIIEGGVNGFFNADARGSNADMRGLSRLNPRLSACNLRESAFKAPYQIHSFTCDHYRARIRINE